MKSARTRGRAQGWARRRISQIQRKHRTSDRKTRHPQFESLEARWQPSGLPLPASGLRVDNVHLVRDTGQPNDRVTINAAISGTVAGTATSGVRVEFDHGGDGLVDGSVNVTTSDGSFVYDPRGADTSLESYAGALSVRYRAVRQDGATPESTAWQTFSYQLLQPPAASYVVTDVGHHASQTAPVGLWITGSLLGAGGAVTSGSGSTSGAVGSGLVAGGSSGLLSGYNAESDLTVSEPDWSQDDRFQPISGPVLSVEIDTNSDGRVDGRTTAEDGRFEFRAEPLHSGRQNFRMRAAQWDTTLGMLLRGPWTDYVFQWSPSAPAIGELALANDTGPSGNDGRTWDATVRGSLVSPFTNSDGVNVEWDLDANGVAEGSQSVQDDGNFSFVPQGLTPGRVPLRVRTASWDPISRETVFGSWVDFPFFFELPPDPQIASLRLLEDDGESATDLVTSNSAIVGNVIGNVIGGGLQDVPVEWDQNNDGRPDGLSMTDAEGVFQFSPIGLAAGTVTVRARVAASDGQPATSLNDWTSLTFSLAAGTVSAPPAVEPTEITDTRPAIIDLRLLADSGISAEDGRTENTTIAGQVENVASRWLVLQTDDDGDGAADQSIRVEDDGSFRFQPRLPDYGPAQVGTRLVYWNSAALNWAAGPWQELSFVYEDQPDEAPRLFDLAARIADPIDDAGRIRLTGRITNEASLADVSVEVDFDGDSQPDIYTRTEDDGSFSVLFAMQDALAASEDGSLSLSIRTREWSDDTSEDRFGAWQTHVVAAFDVQPEPARIVTLGIADSDDAAGVRCLRGTIDRDPLGESVIIEFDHNGDGRVEATVTVDSARRFEYSPQGLAAGNVALRARTRDYVPGRGWLRSDWSSVSVVVDEAANPQLTIQSIELVRDDGNSRQDRSTSDPTLRVRAAGAGGSSSVLIDFDYNQDGVSDETAPLVSGELTHKPQQLLNGWVPLEVRARSEDGTATGDWQSFGFVYSDQPDSAEAQAWLAAAGRYDAELAAAQLARDQLVQSANTDQATALSNAEAGYEAAIQSAYATERQLTNAANAQFDRDVAQADSEYLAALQEANAAYLQATHPLTDDGPRLALERLDWPDLPAAGVLPLPDDADQPAPPVAPFDDSGPAYDYGQDPAYQAEVSQAETESARANKSARDGRQRALDSAEEEYQQQLRSIQKRYDQGYQNASKSYAEASQKTPATDLQAAAEVYRRETQAVQDSYDAAIETFVAEFRVVFDAARTSLESGQKSAQSVYSKAVEVAQQNYNRTLANIRFYDCNQLRQASIVYETAVLEASKVRDVTVSTARNTYDHTIASALQKYRQQVASARHTRYESNSAATRRYDEAKAQYDLERKLIQIAANVNFQKAKADLVRERAWSTADAAVVRDRRIALTERVYQFAVESAKHSQWLAVSDARLRVAKASHQSDPSPWTEHQLALAQNEANYTAARVGAREAYVSARIAATYRRSVRLAEAARDRGRGLAAADAVQQEGHAQAKSAYWSEAASKQWTETLGRARNRQQLRDEFLKQQEIYDRDAADAQLAFALSGTDAWHTYATEQALARKWTPPANTCTGGLVLGGTTPQITLGGLEQPSDTYALGQNVLQKKLQAASHALQLSNIRCEAVLSAARRQIEQQYETNMAAEETAKAQALAGNLRVYHEALARTDRQHAIDVVHVESIETNETASADLALAESVAPLDQQFADADSRLIAVRRVADAQSEGQFRINAASVHAGTLAAWNSVQATAWSEYHQTLGQIELVHARAQAEAELAATKKTVAAETARSEALALAVRIFGVEQARAVRRMADATVSARETAAAAAADAKRDYAYAVAGLDLRRADTAAREQSAAQARQASYDSTHDAAAAAADTAFQVAMADMWLVLMNSQADAEYTYATAVSSAETAWRSNKISTEAYKQTVTAADAARVDDRLRAENNFNSSAEKAWDALRAARAAEIEAQILFRVQSHSIWLDLEQTSQFAYSGDMADAARKLANSMKGINIALATGLHQVELVLATTEAGLDQAYTVATTAAEATYTVAVESAQLDETRDSYLADAAKRESSTSARGIYETALRRDQAKAAAQSVSLLGSRLAGFQRQLALLGEQWSEQTRVARDAHEDAVTAITTRYLVAQNAADLAWITDTSSLDAEHSASKAAAEAARQTAEAAASAKLQIANAAIEANWTAKETIADIDYDVACAAAARELYRKLVSGYETWSAAIVAPSSQHYLDTTEDQVPFWAAQFTTTTPYSALGYASSGTSVNVGTGVDDYRMAGGYVFGVPNIDPSSFRQLLASYTPWIGVRADMTWQPPVGDIDPWNNSREADDRYSLAMSAAWKPRTDGAQLAEFHYLTAIGNAQIARAGVLGDAAIQAARDRGTAAIAQVAAIDQARSTYLRTATALDAQDQLRRTAAKTRHVLAGADLRTSQLRDQGDATAAWITAQNSLDLEFTRQAAIREANFQLTVAADGTALAREILDRPLAVIGTPIGKQTVEFAAALEQWIALVTPDFIAHSVETQRARGQWELRIDQLRSARLVSQAAADEVFFGQSVQIENDFALQSQSLAASNRSARDARESTATQTYAIAQQSYETAVAQADKQYAIDFAAAQKQFQIGRLENPKDATRRRVAAVADATFTRSKAIADAEFAWRQADAMTRQQKTLAEAGAEHAFATGSAAIDQQQQSRQAAADAMRQVAYAQADEVFAQAESAANIRQRKDLADADLTLWSEEAIDRITAHATIDARLETEWSDFLRYVARSEFDALASLKPDYVALVDGTNQAESVYAMATSQARLQRDLDGAATDSLHADQLAKAGQKSSNDLANARLQYVQQMAEPSRTAVEALARAQRTRDIAVAQATRDLQDHKDQAKYKQDVERANAALRNARQAARSVFVPAEAQASSTRDAANAEASYDESIAAIAADRLQQDSLALQTRTFQVKESAAYVNSAEAHSLLDRNYLFATADSLAEAMTALAQSHPSRWAALEAARSVAYQDWTRAVGNEQWNTESAQARNRSGLEISLAKSDYTLATSQSRAAASTRTAAAEAELARIRSFAQAVLVAGGSTIYQRSMPALDSPPAIADDYSISKASDRPYSVRILVTESLGWYAVPYQPPTWSVISAFNVFDFGSVPGDFGLSLRLDESARVVLTEPAPPALPAKFWEIAAEMNRQQQMSAGWMTRYETIPDANYAQSKTGSHDRSSRSLVPVVIPSMPRHDPRQIAQMLEATDGQLAEFFRTHATVVRQQQTSRPRPRGAATGVAHLGTDLLPESIAPRNSLEQVALTYPDDWDNSAFVAAIDQTFGTNAACRDDQPVAAIFSPGQLQRLKADSSIEAGSGGLDESGNEDAPKDQIIVHKNGDVIWHSPRFVSEYAVKESIDTLVGKVHGSWIQLESGGRTTLTALKKIARLNRRADESERQSALNGIKSPYQKHPSSQQIGVFIGGTSMHMYAQGNVERLYNLYQGSKFYYGGIANPVDFRAELISKATGWGWTDTLDRAEEDILQNYRPGDKVHLFGFSRGAAMAAELGKRLEAHRISVEFLGLFDPVYSLGFFKPGPNSELVDGSWDGYQGNYVTATMSSNVKASAIIYAANEDRTWFPATRYTAASTTDVTTIRSPGGHGEIGGHWASNLKMQHLNLRAMIEYARGHGGVELAFHGLDQEIKDILESPYTLDMAKEEANVEITGEKIEMWFTAAEEKSWAPYSATQFIDLLNTQDEASWAPGGYDTQRTRLPNPVVLRNRWNIESFAKGDSLRIQPASSHYVRDLSWVDLDVYDLFPNGSTDAGGQLHTVKPESMLFIHSLYEKTINPSGDWRPEVKPIEPADTSWLY